jgi:hypothetical protein
MPQITRQDFLRAVRTDHPEFAKFDDDILFKAVSADHPELVASVSNASPPLTPAEIAKRKAELLASGRIDATLNPHGVDTADTAGPDMRSATDVAIDQARQVGEGVKGLVPGIVRSVQALPSNVRALAEATRANPPSLTQFPGDVVRAGVDIAKTVLPVEAGGTVVRGVGALANVVNAPTREEWEAAAQQAGANAAALTGGELLARAGPAVKAGARSAIDSALTTKDPFSGIETSASENLMTRANANEANGSLTLRDVAQAHSSLGAALELVAKVYGKAAAPLQRAVAGWLDSVNPSAGGPAEPPLPGPVPQPEERAAITLEDNELPSALPRMRIGSTRDTVRPEREPVIGRGGAPSYVPPDAEKVGIAYRPSPDAADFMEESRAAVAEKTAEANMQDRLERAWQQRGREADPVPGNNNELPSALPRANVTYRPHPDAEALPTVETPSLSPAEVNRWMNVTVKQVSHGANPGARLVGENLVGATKEATAQNVAAALDASGRQLGAMLDKAGEAGARINASDSVIDILNSIKKRIGSPKGSTFANQIDSIWDDITERYPHLDNLTPREAHQLKQEVGDVARWSGPAADEPVNEGLVRIYRDLNNKIRSAVPGAGEEQSRWSDLYVGTKALQESMRKDLIGRGTGPAPQAKP